MVKNDAGCEKNVLLNINTHAFNIQSTIDRATCLPATVRSAAGSGCEYGYGFVGLLPRPARSKSGGYPVDHGQSDRFSKMHGLEKGHIDLLNLFLERSRT